MNSSSPKDWRALRHACRALRGDREVGKGAQVRVRFLEILSSRLSELCMCMLFLRRSLRTIGMTRGSIPWHYLFQVARRAVGQDPRALLLTTAQLQGDLNFTMAAVAQSLAGRAASQEAKARMK